MFGLKTCPPAIVCGSVLALSALGGCDPVLPAALTTDPAFIDRAATLSVFAASMAPRQPRIVSVVQHVRAVSCHYRFDLKAGEATSLAQLKMQALAAGGNGVIDVKSELIVNNKSPCWHGFEATGVAVVFDRGQTP